MKFPFTYNDSYTETFSGGYDNLLSLQSIDRAGDAEIVADGSPGVNSPFAASILYLLRNNTKQLGVQELCAHVIESVISNAIQTPIGEPLTIPGHKGGQFVFRLKKNEARDWAATLEAGDLKAYETFVALYPGGENIQKASETLIRLKEEKLWEEVKEANTIKAYITYKKQYPNGKFVDLAIERIEDLEDERDWKIACRQNRISAYMKYKRNYPDGTFVAEADAKIKELEQGRPIQNEETSHQGGGVIVETPSIKIETKPSKEEVPAGLSGAGSADISYEHQTTPGKKVYDSKFIKFGLPAIILAIFLAIKFFPGNSDPKITEATTPITDLTNKGAETGTTPEREKPLENPTDESTKTPERESGKNESTNPPTRRPELDLKTDFKPKTEIDRSIRPTITTKEETKLEIEKPKLPAPVLELNNSMIKIPVGQFVMGTETQKDAPIHQVTLSRRFAISKNEVTQELWKAVMGNAPSKRKNCAQCPVENVSFYDVQEFLKKLYQMTGKKYRLPTEAEWEFAASGGKNPDLAYVKASNLNRLAYYGANSGNKTNPVASKRPNKFGLYDMLGNVQEWCLDWYDEGFYKDGQKNPYNRNKGIAASKVIRGGSYLTVGEKVRVFKRSAMSPSQKRPTIGFRVVLD